METLALEVPEVDAAEALPRWFGFTRQLRRLLMGQSNESVGQRLGYSLSRIGQVLRGERPSREFVERLIEVYELPREEWLSLAGYAWEAKPDRETRLALRVAEETVRMLLKETGPQYGFGATPVADMNT